MALSDLSLRRPVFAWMFLVSLILFGAFSFQRLGISQLPDVDFPVISISLNYPGAAPEVMESSVVDAIEDSVMGIEGVRRVTSSSLQGVATIAVEFELDRNIDLALGDVQAKVDQARRVLPTDLDPPVITKSNPDDQPILWLALTSDRHSRPEMARFIRDEIKGRFATISGVGDIRFGGYLEPNLRVWVDPSKLAQYQLTMGDVVNTIQQEHYEPPSGYLEMGDREVNVRMPGEAESPKELSKVAINTRGGQVNFLSLPLSSVAKLEDGTEDVRRIARSSGVPAIGMGIQKQRGANAVAVARQVRERLAEVAPTLPEGMKLEVRNDLTRFIEEAIQELQFTLLMAAVLTALVCWAFLGSWTATLNILTSIPASVIGSFTALYFLGFTLNTFTLLALSLAIGIVVDDSIMVLENIVRRRQEGEGKVEAALFGTRQITLAAIASTASILAVFVPVAFLKGIIGKFFFQFAMAMSVAFIISVLDALIMTPVLTSRFLKLKPRRTRIGRAIDWAFTALSERYRRGLALSLDHRIFVLVGSLAIFAVSILLLQTINREFLPPEDQGQFMIRARTPLGSSMAFTQQKMGELEEQLSQHPAVESYFTVIGGFMGGQVNQGFAFVNLKRRNEREASQAALMRHFRKTLNAIPDFQAILQDRSARGFTASRGFPIELTVQGPEWGVLVEHTREIVRRLDQTGLVTDLDTDYEGEFEELAIVPNRDKADARSVSVAEIGNTIAAAVGGMRVARFTSQGRRYDVRVKQMERPGEQALPPEQRLRGLYVRNSVGELVPLLSVVDLVRRQAPLNLTRVDRQRAVTIFANIAEGQSQQAALDEGARIAREVLPEHYSARATGAAETFQESVSGLLMVLLLGIAVAYMVLAVQFNSFTDPIAILSILPVTATGAFVALFLTSQSLNLYSMIGLILLMGIATKDSILLVDFTNQVRDEKQSTVRDALMEACPIRLRPVLMTTIATLAGALPIALALGPGAESRRPMAIAVIGGILFSTLLTLYVVPVVYSYLTRERANARQVEELLKKDAA